MESTKDIERRKLQEDIERLQDIIGEDDFVSDNDSDNDVLQIDFNSTVPTEGDDEFRQTPGAISSCPGSIVQDDDDDRDEIVINLNEDVPIDHDTCLALNKAYQEVLLDTLRSIEMALIENRDKQDKINESFESDEPKKLKTAGSSKRSINSYVRPFFMDDQGKVPAPNVDVILKKRADEHRQDIKPGLPWKNKMKEDLIEAVYLDALQQQTRPLLNRKDIYYEKLAHISKEATPEEYEDLSQKIDEIDSETHRITILPKDEIIRGVDTKRIDWMKIANTTMNCVREATELELYWNNELSPSINKEKWSKDETDKLKDLVDKYSNRNWPAIAKELGTNRTAFQCLQYYQQNLNELFIKRPWTDVEDQMLIEVVENIRIGSSISWNQVSYFLEGRNSAQCSNRWTQINPAVKRGKWSDEEDMKLLAAIYLFGDRDWEKITEFVPNRTITQCRERYKSSLDPALRPPALWSYEEDKQLLLLCEDMQKSDGRKPWAKIAECMKGRTDNMVLCRYKKLMEWKEKCEWLAKQGPKQRAELGYIDVEELAKDGRSRKPKYSYQQKDEYKVLAHKLSRLPTANEYKYDYIKQLKDKREGNFVVPRPPLMYRYTRRSTVNIWARKKHMKSLLEAHLAKLNITNTEQRYETPSRTAEEFKPFTLLNERQIAKIEKVLQTKNPCEISVKELIDLTNEDKKNYNDLWAQKCSRKKRIDKLIEGRILNVLQYKHCYITKWRKPSAGRPKKFYLFYPGGRKPHKFDTENTVQISTVTSTLLLNALEVDGKKALAIFQSLPAKEKKQLTPLFTLLTSCFPQTIPPKMSVNSTVATTTFSSPSTSTSSMTTKAPPSTITSATETTLRTTTSTTEKAQTMATSMTDASKNVETKRKRGRPSNKVEKGVKRKETEDDDDTCSQRDDSSMSKIVNNIFENTRKEMKTSGQNNEEGVVSAKTRSKSSPERPKKILKVVQIEDKSPGRKRKSTEKPDESTAPKVLKLPTLSSPIASTSCGTISLPKIVTMKSTSTTGTPVPTALVMNSSVNKQGQNTMVLPNMIGANTLKPGQTMPMSNPRVIVIRQPATGANVNKFPILPPCVTTMRGYEEFLIQSNLLKSRATDCYNAFFYQEKTAVLEGRLDAVRNENAPPSRLQFDDSIDRAREIGAKKVNAVLSGRGVKLDKASYQVHPKKDLLKGYRNTPEFVKLKKRFDALFLWPAFLSLLKPDDENVFDEKEEDKKLVTFDQYIDIIEPKVEEKRDVTIVKVQEKKPRTNDAARSKLFVKCRQKHIERKEQISQKRRLAKQMQIKAIAEKGREKIKAEKEAREKEKLEKKINRYKHLGQRASQRISKKQEEKPITYVYKKQFGPKRQKLRSMTSLTREMDKERGTGEHVPKYKKLSLNRKRYTSKHSSLKKSTVSSLKHPLKHRSGPATSQQAFLQNVGDGLLPTVLPSQQGGVPATETVVLSQAPGMVPMISSSQQGMSSPPGTIVIPPLPSSAVGVMPQMPSSAVGVMPHMPSSAVRVMPQLPSSAVGLMPQVPGLSIGVMPQVSSSAVGVMPQVSSSAVGAMPQVSSSAVGAMPQMQGIMGGMVPIMFPQVSTSTVSMPQQVGQTGVTTAPSQMIHPIFMMPPTAGNSQTTAVGASPFPVFIVPNITGAGVSSDQSIIAPPNNISSPPFTVSQVNSCQSDGNTGASVATSSSPISIKTSPSSAPGTPKNTPEKSEMSHLFLGNAPGQEGGPMLISVPKDSNMTIKELIQMIGKGGAAGTCETPKGDNSSGDSVVEASKGNNSSKKTVELSGSSEKNSSVNAKGDN